MDRKCQILAVNVYIVPFLQLTGDLNNCARGTFLAFAMSLQDVRCEPLSKSTVFALQVSARVT